MNAWLLDICNSPSYLQIWEIVLLKNVRESGFGVTEISGRGKDGTVTMLHCGVMRKDKERVKAVVRNADPAAFVSAEEMRPVRRGFWRA